MLLASDIGGTKTLLGLFSSDPDRPSPIEVGEFSTLDYDGLEPMVREFLSVWKVDPRTITATCIGVAGAVTDQVARLTNVPWLVDAEAVATTLGLKHVEVINDLEALAYAVPVLEPTELAVLQQGIALPGGNAAVIAAGTGLGEAMLHNVDGRFVPFAPARLCVGVGANRRDSDLAGDIYESAREGRCRHCVEAFDMFVSAYGSEAGNLALRAFATAGVYIGGGIAPKIMPALESGLFLEAFRAKEPMADLVATIPVSVILNPDAGLLGAAVRAVALAEPR
jgi:glucokinase